MEKQQGRGEELRGPSPLPWVRVPEVTQGDEGCLLLGGSGTPPHPYSYMSSKRQKL